MRVVHRQMSLPALFWKTPLGKPPERAVHVHVRVRPPRVREDSCWWHGTTLPHSPQRSQESGQGPAAHVKQELKLGEGLLAATAYRRALARLARYLSGVHCLRASACQRSLPPPSPQLFSKRYPLCLRLPLHSSAPLTTNGW